MICSPAKGSRRFTWTKPTFINKKRHHIQIPVFKLLHHTNYYTCELKSKQGLEKSAFQLKANKTLY